MVKMCFFTREQARRAMLGIFLILSFGVSSFSQGFTVTGKVTDSKTGEPLPFVNVIIKGTTEGTTTDNDGNYTLKVPGGNVSLRFSFVGYEDVFVPVNGQKVINVKMSEVSEQLNEVVVIGYGVQKKSDLSGSVASVKSEELLDIPAAEKQV